MIKSQEKQVNPVLMVEERERQVCVATETQETDGRVKDGVTTVCTRRCRAVTGTRL